MSIVIQFLGLSAEVLLIFIFLPFSCSRKNRLILLPVYIAAIVLVTLAGPQDPFYTIAGIVVLRLAVFTAFILCYFDLPAKHCVSLAMTYFLLTQPARRIVTAVSSYCSLHTSSTGGQVLSTLLNMPVIRSPLIFLIQLLVLIAVRQWGPELEMALKSPLAKTQNILLLGLYLYVRYNEKYWGFSDASRAFDLFMIAIVYMSIISATILTVHMLIFQQREQLQREIFLSSQQQYHAVMEQMRSDSSLRRIYHDLRKHLDALSAMAGDQKDIQNYLQELTHAVEGQLSFVDTGDAMMDAFLSRRIADAAAEHISINACVDLRQGGFIAPIDKIAIFGNILDNAIEAVRQVNEPNKRRIVLKTDAQHGALLIRSNNYFAGDLLTSGDRLISTKSDSSMHGIGISSIRHSVAKYGGTVDISTDENRFSITILIPLPTV